MLGNSRAPPTKFGVAGAEVTLGGDGARPQATASGVKSRRLPASNDVPETVRVEAVCTKIVNTAPSVGPSIASVPISKAYEASILLPTPCHQQTLNDPVVATVIDEYVMEVADPTAEFGETKTSPLTLEAPHALVEGATSKRLVVVNIVPVTVNALETKANPTKLWPLTGPPTLKVPTSVLNGPAVVTLPGSAAQQIL
jgi:hypothetical protein